MPTPKPSPWGNQPSNQAAPKQPLSPKVVKPSGSSEFTNPPAESGPLQSGVSKTLLQEENIPGFEGWKREYDDLAGQSIALNFAKKSMDPVEHQAALDRLQAKYHALDRKYGVVNDSPSEYMDYWEAQDRHKLIAEARERYKTTGDPRINLGGDAAPVKGEPTRTTTVGKQPTDVKVYGDFEVGTDAMMEKVIAGQKMTAPMGKITELYLKPEKVLKPNPMPGQGASKITTTEQVPYAKFEGGREAPLSQLKKVNAPQTSPDKVKEMLKAPKKEPVPEVDDKTIIKEIRRIMNETGSKVTYSNVKKVLPNMSRNGFERAFERMKEQDPSLIKATNKETKEQFIARGKVDAETRLKASEAEKSKHFDKAIKQLRGKENLKYAYLRNLMDTTNLEKVGARLNVKAATQRVNQMIKDGAIKVYPEGEPESPVKSVTQGMFSPLDEDIDYVIEFIKKN
jgi:hypothetical protein